MAADPNRIAGYKRLVGGFVAFGSLPWLVLAVHARRREHRRRFAPGSTWRLVFFGVLAADQRLLSLWVFVGRRAAARRA